MALRPRSFPIAQPLSLRLWRAIFHNSLYQFPVLLRSPGGTPDGTVNSFLPYHLWQLRGRSSIIMSTVTLTAGALVLVLFPFLIPALMMVVFVLVVVFAGTLSGWMAASRIAGTIFREQEKERYDLLLMTPPGVLGVHWAIVTRSLRDDRLLRWLRWLPSGFFILLSFLLFGLFIGILSTSFLWVLNDSALGFSALFQVSLGLVLVGILYSDYFQSVVIGVLIGILLPTYNRSQAENAAYALVSASFFSLQVLYYLVLGLVWLGLSSQVIIPALIQNNYLPPLLIAGLTLLTTFTLREGVVRFLWRMAEDRLYFDAQDSGVRA